MAGMGHTKNVEHWQIMLAACGGIVTSIASILSGAHYDGYGQGTYYVMAAMALSGAASVADLAPELLA